MWKIRKVNSMLLCISNALSSGRKRTYQHTRAHKLSSAVKLGYSMCRPANRRTCASLSGGSDRGSYGGAVCGSMWKRSTGQSRRLSPYELITMRFLVAYAWTCIAIKRAHLRGCTLKVRSLNSLGWTNVATRQSLLASNTTYLNYNFIHTYPIPFTNDLSMITDYSMIYLL